MSSPPVSNPPPGPCVAENGWKLGLESIPVSFLSRPWDRLNPVFFSVRSFSTAFWIFARAPVLMSFLATSLASLDSVGPDFLAMEDEEDLPSCSDFGFLSTASCFFFFLIPPKC